MVNRIEYRVSPRSRSVLYGRIKAKLMPNTGFGHRLWFSSLGGVLTFSCQRLSIECARANGRPRKHDSVKCWCTITIKPLSPHSNQYRKAAINSTAPWSPWLALPYLFQDKNIALHPRAHCPTSETSMASCRISCLGRGQGSEKRSWPSGQDAPRMTFIYYPRGDHPM